MRWLALLLLAGCPAPDDTAKVDGDVVDADGDGFTDGEDCRDDDAGVHPGVEDGCDGVDEDCDGSVDEDAAQTTWYRDQDGDGYGDPAQPEDDCRQPAGYVADFSDCGPARLDAYPGAPEKCDGIDHDCDGEVMDADAIDAYLFYEDLDSDGFGNPFVFTLACYDPGGFVGNPLDCDDTRDDVNPAAPEVCDEDNVDEDCDLLPDELDDYWAGGDAYYIDADGDGHGDLDGVPVWLCAPALGYAPDYIDCDDSNALIHGEATERCNGLDDDCDEEIDEADAVDVVTWYEDRDLDGYGDATRTEIACDAPEDYVATGDDCDDRDDGVYPGAPEECLYPYDQNCDGYYGETDNDGDGFDACDECDDGDAAVFPDGDERCNGVDDDCDGEVDEADAIDPSTWYADLDGDGYGDASANVSACDAPEGYVSDADDCDDADAAIHPGATESCEEDVDADCDGLVTYADTDGDGSADCVDCAPEDAAIHPGATETPGDGVDQDCDGLDVGADVLAGLGWYGAGDTSGLGAGALISGVDLDGDGVGDLLLSAPTTNTGSYANGMHSVVAPSVAGIVAVADVAAATVVGRGATGLMGGAVAAADQDGNAQADLFFGAEDAGFGGTGAGEARLLLGPFSGSADVEVNAVTRVLCAEAGIGCGRDVGLSDQDGDGTAELFVSAHLLDDVNVDDGAVLIYAGTLTGDLTEADATARLLGVAGVGFGGTMRLADLDGDGVDDLAAGDDAGTLHVFTGPLGDGTTDDAVSVSTGSTPFTITDGADVDGDGQMELVLGDAVTGRTWLSAADGAVWLEVSGAGSVGLLTDLDGSGTFDLCVGDPAAPNGAVRIFVDPTGGTLVGGDAAITRTGAAAGDAVGTMLAPLADIDGDGRGELLVGAPGTDTLTSDDGFIHVLLGAELP